MDEKWAEVCVKELASGGGVSVQYSETGEPAFHGAIPSSFLPDHGEPDKLGEALHRLTTGLSEFQAACSQDPNESHSSLRLLAFEQELFRALDRFAGITQTMSPRERRKQQERVYGAIKPFVAESDAFSRILEKPLGYPGDHLLIEMLCENSTRARGIGYLFDRTFLSSPGAEAVRQRTKWTVRNLEALLLRKPGLSLLDLGCGPMVIERTLAARLCGGQRVDVLGLDFDEKALSHAQSFLANPRMVVRTRQVSLVSLMGQLRDCLENMDAIICMGLIEYLRDETVLLLLETIHNACAQGTNVLLANFKPDHFSRRAMEWLQDWWLVYRTEADMKKLAMAAGFDEGKIRTELDHTSSVVLVELEK
jgi:extracellular factor (EF) 3-hydroxypalmitic acid methyl ester biosynthesis protein